MVDGGGCGIVINCFLGCSRGAGEGARRSGEVLRWVVRWWWGERGAAGVGGDGGSPTVEYWGILLASDEG